MIALLLLVVISTEHISPHGKGDPLAPYRGQPVLDITVDAPPVEDVAALRKLISIEPGYILSTSDLQSSIKRLYALGRFARVDVYAERNSGAVSLHFHLQYAIRLRNLRIIGLRGLGPTADSLRGALGLIAGDVVDRSTAAALEGRAKAHLATLGFSYARVEVDVEVDAPAGRANVVVFVEPGSPVVIKDIRFPQSARLPPKALLQEITLRPGMRLNHRQLEEDRERLVKAYLRRGFLHVRISPAKVHVEESRATVEFPIEANERVSFVFHGNASFPAAKLQHLWPNPDAPAEPDFLRQFAVRIERFYTEQGRPATEVQTRVLRSPNDGGLMHYIVKIKEGERRIVRSIEFEGAHEFDPAVLVKQVEATLESELGAKSVLEPLSEEALNSAWANRRTSDPAIPPRARWVPHLYEQAIKDIIAAYRDRGFLQARAGPIRRRTEGMFSDVKIPIHEGPQTLVGSISFNGNQALNAGLLLQVLAAPGDRPGSIRRLDPGSPYSPNAVEDSRIELIRLYRDHGYLYARVFAHTEFSDDKTQANLVYRFEEGPQVRLRTVLVRGHHYTREGLLRDRLSLKEGDLYRLEQALFDQRNIAGLGVFSSVRVRLIDEETPGELKDLVAEVVERDRQPLDLALGISTADGPRLRLSYAHINVLGTASTFSASAKINRKVFFALYGELGEPLRDRYSEFGVLEQIERELRVGIRSPRILALPFAPSFRFDLVQERDNAIPYSLESLTGVMGADLQITRRLLVSLEPQLSLTGLRCESTTVGAQRDDCLGAFASLRPEQRQLDTGLKRTFRIGPRIQWDRRDDPFNPTSGFFFSGEAAYAVGATRDSDQGSNIDFFSRASSWQRFSFTRFQGTVTGYASIRKAVLALSARAGAIHVFPGQSGVEFPSVPIDERFFLGGRDSIRGFVESTLIAEDVCVLTDPSASVPTNCNDVIVPSVDASGATGAPISRGGHSFMLLKSELRIPLAEQLSVGLFVDAGNLWFRYPTLDALAVRVGMGAGLRYGTPVGPIAIDIGINPSPRSSNSEPRWQPHFAIGLF